MNNDDRPLKTFLSLKNSRNKERPYVGNLLSVNIEISIDISTMSLVKWTLVWYNQL